jgi:hypothetical protein
MAIEEASRQALNNPKLDATLESLCKGDKSES